MITLCIVCNWEGTTTDKIKMLIVGILLDTFILVLGGMI